MSAALVAAVLALAPAEAQVQLGEEAFTVELELGLKASEAGASEAERVPCRPLRAGPLAKALLACGGELLQPPFYAEEMTAVVRSPDGEEDACLAAARKALPALTLKGRRPAGLVREGGPPRTPGKVTLRRDGKDVQVNAMVGEVLVYFKPRTESKAAEAVARRHGGRMTSFMSLGALASVRVPGGCEGAYIEAVSREPSVQEALANVVAGPRPRGKPDGKAPPAP